MGQSEREREREMVECMSVIYQVKVSLQGCLNKLNLTNVCILHSRTAVPGCVANMKQHFLAETAMRRKKKGTDRHKREWS